MALRPTIYKFKIALTDVERSYYDTLNLTVAQHPSESIERMMVRILAFCLNAADRLSFTRGISAAEEPDLWVHTLDDQISLWIDVGEPAVERIRKASRLAAVVKVYSFNTKSDVWWSQSKDKFSELPVSVFRFNRDAIKSLAAMVERTMDLSVTVTGDSAYVATGLGECEVSWISLQEV